MVCYKPFILGEQRLKKAALLSTLALIGACDSAQEEPQSRPLLPASAITASKPSEPDTVNSLAHTLPSPEQINSLVQALLADTGAQGFALAVVESGQVSHIATYGDRNQRGDPLAADSIMYGASLTKAAFAYTVLQLVDDGLVDLDTPIADYLPQALPAYTDPDIEDDYARWSDLAGDNRWQRLTPRMLLNHASGFANFGFLEPDGVLRFHFEPGALYSYSGDGIILLQFVLEKGLGLDVGYEMQTRLFDPLGMTDTSLIWRDDYNNRVADGWTVDGEAVPHDERSRVRAAGSMDTSIHDMSLFAAAVARGDLLSAPSRAEFSRPQLPITSASQFPTLQPAAEPGQQHAGLSAGLGVVVTHGTQGPVLFKGGHDDITGNTLVCLETSQRCVVVLGNDLRAESGIPYVVEFILGPTGVPWSWEYAGRQLWQPASQQAFAR